MSNIEKIRELCERCGECELMKYCTEPYESPELCSIEELEDVPVKAYLRMANCITEEEIQEKIKEYEDNDSSPWSNKRAGAICDIVLERLKTEE